MNLDTVVVVLKWLSQALIVVVGVWGLLSDPFEKNVKTGQRRLNRSGWVKVALLGVGFFLFAITDMNERKKSVAQRQHQSNQLQMQSETMAIQKRQMEFLRELLLLQHHLSEVEITLAFSKTTMGKFDEFMQRFKPASRSGQRADPARLAYISTACRTGNAVMRYGGKRNGQLDYSINRPQGLVAETVSEPEPEWQAFEAAWQGLFGDRIEIVSNTGRVLLDLLNPERQYTVRFRSEAIILSLKNPGIRLDELEGKVSFICGKEKPLCVVEPGTDDATKRQEELMSYGPIAVQLVSRDPRVTWNQKISCKWTPIVTRRIQEAETDKVLEVGEWHSDAHTIEAKFSDLKLDLTNNQGKRAIN